MSYLNHGCIKKSVWCFGVIVYCGRVNGSQISDKQPVMMYAIFCKQQQGLASCMNTSQAMDFSLSIDNICILSISIKIAHIHRELQISAIIYPQIDSRSPMEAITHIKHPSWQCGLKTRNIQIQK